MIWQPLLTCSTICCLSFITCSRRLVAVVNKSLFCPFKSLTRSSRRDIRSSFRVRHFRAATLFRARFLSSLILSWDSMLIGERGGEELRHGTVWGSSSSLGKRMSTTGADACTCDGRVGLELWDTSPPADDTGREAPAVDRTTPLGSVVVAVSSCCWRLTTGRVVLWVTVELGGKGCPMELLALEVMTALAWDGWGGGESPSLDWSWAKASTNPRAYASCSSVTNLGKMNCVGVGVVVTKPLPAWMIIFSNSGEASFNMCRSGDCKRAEVFLAFELEPLKSSVMFRLSRLTADSGPFESNIEASIFTEGTRRSSLKRCVFSLRQFGLLDDSQGQNTGIPSVLNSHSIFPCNIQE